MSNTHITRTKRGKLFFVLFYSLLLLLIQLNGFAQSANIDQGDNGRSNNPNSPVAWVNGNLNTTKTHYLEGQSIPYRIVLDNLPLNTPVTVRIGFDLRNSGHYAIDYLTSYDWTATHGFFFKHAPESVNETLALSGTFNGTVYAPLPNPGKKNSPSGWSTQPEASFNAVASQGKAQMALKNASFVNNPSWVVGKEPNYSEANPSYEAQIDVTISASALPVVIGFGGHIASRYDWGTLPNLQARSAGGISGSPYHMRVIQLMYNGTVKSIGNQDRSLQVDAPDCNNLALLISNQQNLLCNGVGGGSVTLATSGGNPGFQYSIDTGKTYQFSNVFSGLAPGNYQFLVRDTIGCVSPVSTTITQPSAIASSGVITDVVCFGEKTGAIDVSVSGGTPGYTYAWSNGATTQDLSALAVGSYNVLITDANGCIKRDTFLIKGPASGIQTSGLVTNILCHEVHTGAIDLTVSGGNPGYNYKWSNGATTQDISALQAGIYDVLVTDVLGCNKRDTFVVTQPASPLDMTFEHTDVLCYGDSTGSINMSVSGGTPGYTFLWSNGKTTEDLNNVKAGFYDVLVTDANGCTKRDTVEISQPASALTIKHTSVDVLCYGQLTGSIDLTVAGGSPDYTFLWSNGAKTEDLSELAAGTYTVLVTDVVGCTIRDTVVIKEPASAIGISGKVTDILCHEIHTGAIDLTVSGGTLSYTYFWSNSATSEDLSGLQAGIYDVLVTDANGCVARDTFTVVQPSSPLDMTFEHVDLKCYGDANGSIDMTVSGGTPGYTYLWSNEKTTEDISGLKGGFYSVLVTDANGCTKLDTVEIVEPPALKMKYTSQDVLCYGENTGSIQISVIGGSPDYTYEWSNTSSEKDQYNLYAGTYSVIITDVLGCVLKDTFYIKQPDKGLTIRASIKDLDCYGVATGSIDLTVEGGTGAYTFEWSNAAITEDLNNIAAGIYYVKVTDENLCFVRDTFEVKQPDAALKLELKKVDVLCFGDSTGSIDLSVTGGTKPYKFGWSNGETTEDIAGLKSGKYVVLVTDDKGCTKKDSIMIEQPASVISISAKVSDVLCKGDASGSIDITVSGGTPAYQYSWSSGETTEDISGKAAGIYYVLITDANQCTLKDTFEIEEPVEKLSIRGSVNDLKCYNDNSGSIDITVSGGTATYTYSWSNGSSNEDLTGLAAGTYTVTITDKNGCAAKETFVVNQPDSVIVNADNKKVCAGVSVDLTATPSGGVWSGDGVTGSKFMKAAAGVYPVYYVYTNGNGCIGKDTAYVTVERCAQGFCTYTQGYYGNTGGKSCSEGMSYTTKGLIQKALSKGSIILGNASLNKTFTIAYSSVDTLIKILPGGGTPTALTYNGNKTPSTLPSNMLKNGRINNVLLSQTIALALNIRINSGMDSFVVRSDKYLITQEVKSCGSKELEECEYDYYKFSKKVVSALSGNKTITDLLKLANNALAGSLPAGLSYSDIAGAVDLVNNAFDECRVGWYSDTIVYCPTVSVSSAASNMTASEQIVQMNIDPISKQPTVKAYPNPFEDMVRFTIESPESIQCNLMLYTASGKLISKVFDGRVEANVARTVQIMVPSIYRGAIMYVLSYNGQVVSGKILKK